MAKSTYHKQLETILSQINPQKKPTLLLHACCGPCSSYVIEYLATYFDITILYYNPNIYPKSEYERRLSELQTFLPQFSPAVINKVKIIIEDYNEQDFYNAIDIKNQPELSHEKEKGKRCRRCYKFRLQRAYEYALNHNFDYFCTTLSISPFKDAEKINQIGIEIENKNNPDSPKWLPSDFKKNGGFLRSLQISSEYNLYRQQYCGCIYSFQNRNQNQL